jgi:hypothetical protein
MLSKTWRLGMRVTPYGSQTICSWAEACEIGVSWSGQSDGLGRALEFAEDVAGGGMVVEDGLEVAEAPP